MPSMFDFGLDQRDEVAGLAEIDADVIHGRSPFGPPSWRKLNHALGMSVNRPQPLKRPGEGKV